MSAGDGRAAVCANLGGRYPGREAQIRVLVDMLHESHQPSPALVLLYDPNSPASTSLLLRDVLAPPTVSVEIDPLVCPTPRSLFSHVWTALGKSTGVPVPALIDDSLDLFLGSLTMLVKKAAATRGKVVFVMQRAERMRNVWPEPVMEALFNMAETISAKGHFALVLISSLPAWHFRTTRGVGLTDAIVVPFPRLAKEDALRTLSLDAERLISTDERHDAPMDTLTRLHSVFVAVAYDSFASDIRDLEQIRLLACCVWYPFIEPLFHSDIPATKPQALLSRGSFLFRDALSRLHTKEIGPLEWVEQMVEQVRGECGEEGGMAIQRPRPGNKGVQLPLIPTFLLLASFLASYNPTRLDVRYFVRDESALLPEMGGKSSKRRRVVRRGGAGSRNRQEMLGPKAFALDRLLSIFQALMTEAGPEVQTWVGEEQSQVKSDFWETKSRSVAVMEGINTLVSLNLLVRTSASERLEGTMLMRTNVTFDVATQVSRRAKFQLDEWLWDWDQ